MTFSAKILADSTNVLGNRLITMEMTYPRFVHAEHLRHRMFSFNVASSRAIPVEKMIEQVEKNPVIPIHWGKAQKGMQAYECLEPEDAMNTKDEWLYAACDAVFRARQLMQYGLHKQIINRILEPWMWCTVICTGNIGAWNNFWALRCHPEAEPHIRKIAEMTEQVACDNQSHQLAEGEWHLPSIGFDGDGELSFEDAVKVSAGRCARVSYLTHDGKRDVQADIALHDRLIASKHFSPTEHQARADRCSREWAQGNLGQGWTQYRKTLKGEYQDER
jgi:thymidylate synthase ThyX